MSKEAEGMEQEAESVEIPNEEGKSKKRGIFFKIFYVLFFPFKIVLKFIYKRFFAIIANFLAPPLGTLFAIAELYFYAWILQEQIYPFFGIYPH
jgi:hypothetical protein